MYKGTHFNLKMIVAQYFDNTYTIKHLDAKNSLHLNQKQDGQHNHPSFQLVFYATILPRLRHSDSFSKLIPLASEPTNMRYSVNLEIELSVLVLLDGANGTLGFKISAELRRIEPTCYRNIFECT